MLKKEIREYFQWIENPNKAPVLAVWECPLCVCMCFCAFFSPQRNRRQLGYNVMLLRRLPPSHVRSWLIPAQPRSPPTVYCCCHRAPLMLSITPRHACSGPRFQNKIKMVSWQRHLNVQIRLQNWINLKTKLKISAGQSYSIFYLKIALYKHNCFVVRESIYTGKTHTHTNILKCLY